MSNVLEFRRPASAAMNDEAATIRDFWQNTFPGMVSDEVDDVLVDVLNEFAGSKYLVDLPVIFWGCMDFEFKFGDNDTRLELRTGFREKLVPEYGVQNNRTFLTVTMIDDKEPSIFPQTPNDILHRLMEYSYTFGEVRTASRMQFAMAILAGLLDHPGSLFVSAGVEDSRFVAVFRAHTRDTKPGPLCRFEFDFLPLLLDNLAVDYLQTVIDPQ